MKIASQTSDQMVLKDPNYWGIFYAIALAAFGIFFSFAMPSQAPAINSVIMWAIFLIIMFFIIFASPSYVLAFDKGRGTIFFNMKRIVLSKKALYQIADIARIEWRKRFQRTNKGTRVLTQSVIVFKDGSEVPLEARKAEGALAIGGLVISGDLPQDRKESSLANQVAVFLGVPFQEVSPQN